MDEKPSQNAQEQEQEAVALEAEIQALRCKLHALESQYSKHMARDAGMSSHHRNGTWDASGHGLSKGQVERYSRQIILPSFGVSST